MNYSILKMFYLAKANVLVAVRLNCINVTCANAAAFLNRRLESDPALYQCTEGSLRFALDFTPSFHYDIQRVFPFMQVDSILDLLCVFLFICGVVWLCCSSDLSPWKKESHVKKYSFMQHPLIPDAPVHHLGEVIREFVFTLIDFFLSAIHETIIVHCIQFIYFLHSYLLNTPPYIIIVILLMLILTAYDSMFYCDVPECGQKVAANHTNSGFIVQSNNRKDNKNKTRVTSDEKRELRQLARIAKRSNRNPDPSPIITPTDEMFVSKKDKARSFHSKGTYVPKSVLASVASMEESIATIARSLYSATELMDTNTGFKLDFTNTLGESPTLRPVVYSWMYNLRLTDIYSMLKACKTHEYSQLSSHPYTLERARLISEASRNILETRGTFVHAIATIMFFAPAYVPVILQTQEKAYPLPSIYTYFSLAQVQLEINEYGKHSMSITRGSANFLHDLFKFPVSKISKAQLIGVFVSLDTKHNGDLTSIKEDIRSRYPLLKRVVELNVVNRQPALTRLVNRPIWFTNCLHREYFYISHAAGSAALFELIASKVQSLQDQIVDYCEEYLKYRRLSQGEKSMVKQAKAQVFKSIMQRPDTQAKFHAGISKQEICNEIYKEHQSQLKIQALPSVVTTRIAKRKGKSRYKALKKARLAKTAFLVETNTTLVSGILHEAPSNMLVTLISAFTTLVAILSGILYTVLRVNQRVDRTADVVDTTLRSWSAASLFTLDRESNPEYLVKLIEVKTVIHMLYEWQYGTKVQVMNWASNFLITRSSSFVVALTNVCSLFYTSTPEDPQDFVVQTDPKMVVDAYTHLTTFLNSLNIKLTPEEIRLANSEFAYLNNLKKDANDKAQFACTVVSVICRVLFSFDPFDVHFQEFSYTLLQCVQFVNSWDLKQPVTNDELQSVVDAYHRFSHLPRDPQMVHVPSYLKQLFTTKYQKLESMASEANNVLVGDVRRVEPVVLLLTGAPGSGKTTAMNFIKQAIANLSDGKVDNYTMNIASDYFEGYRNQTFVTMDDMFVTTDTSERSTEVKHVINMTNSTPFNLNMAFGEKGKKFFNSKYILMTTNALRPDQRLEAGLTDTEAFLRRCHIRANRDEACTGNIVEDTFVVTHCQVAPNLVGRRLNAGQLAKVMLKQREVFEHNYQQSSDTAHSMYQLDSPEYEVPELDQFQVQTNVIGTYSTPKHDYSCTPETYIKLFFQQVNSAVCWWQDSWIPFIVVLFMTLATATVCLKFFFPDLSFEAESHDERKKKRNPRANRRRKERRQKRVQLKRGGKSKFSAQDMVESDQIKMSISPTSVHLVCRYITPEGSYITNCVAHHIRDNVYMLPSHFYDDVSDYEVVDFVVYTVHGRYSLPFPDGEDFIGPEALDVTFVQLKLPHKPAELYKYLLSDENDSIIENFVEGCCFALLGRDDKGTYTKDVVKSRFCRPLEYDYGDFTYYVEHPWYYEGQTNRGDSGASLCYLSPNGKAYVIGMHAGKLATGNLGAAVPISKELVDDVIGHFQVQSSTFPFPIEGTVQKAVNIPTRTRIRRSRMYGYRGPPKCIPAKLSAFMHDGQLIDPKALALTKLHTEYTPPTPVPEDVLDYLMALYPPHENFRDVLSVDMAMQGDPSRGIPSIDATTSPGYPYCLQSTKGKAPFVVTVDGKHEFGSPEIRQMILDMEKDLREGKQIEVLWPDMLKDETRPIEKVLKGKTRIFSTCPLHYLIIGRMYFQPFITYIQSLAATKPVSVGINVHSNEWDILRNRMTKFPDGSSIAGDFENWDGLVAAFVGRVFLRFVNAWYDDGPVNARVRELLMEHIFCSTRLHEFIIYLIRDGNPSGNFMTSIYNSFVQLIKWYTVLKLDFGLTPADYEIAVYGDDNLLNIRKPGLTTADFAPHFKRRFGMNYTHWSKDQQVNVTDTIDTVTYLGRRFVRSDGYTLAPLELDVIYESIYWRKSENKAMELELTVQIVRSIAMELSHHSLAVFTEEIALLRSAIMERFKEDPVVIYIIDNHNIILPYSEYHMRHYGYSRNITFAEPEVLTSDHITKYDLIEEMKGVLNSLSQIREDLAPTFPIRKPRHVVEQQSCDLDFKPQSHMLSASYGNFIPESQTQRADVTEHGDMTTTTDNSQFTTRAANDLEDTQNVQLGSYQDAAPIVSSAVDTGIIQTPYSNVNMETFDLSDVLNREYPIGSFPWNTANAQGFQLFTISFPQAILAQPFIADKIKNFHNFKAGIRVTFRMSSNMFNYGRVLIRYSPDPTSDAVGPYRTWNTAATSGYPHILLSASSSEVAVFDIPFISSRRALNLTSYVPSEMGMIYATVLNPLTNVMGSVSNSDIFVTAQFIDAKVYLPFAPQSGRRKIVHKKQHNRESIVKSERGVISGALEDTSVVSAALSTVPLIAPYASLYNTLASAAHAVTEIIGLDKPTTLSRTDVVKINPYSDMSNARGIDGSCKLGVDPENGISTMPVVGGVSTDELSIKYIAGTPTCTKIVTFSATSPLNSTQELFNTSLKAEEFTYARWLADLSMYYSGSYKVKLYITASNMHAARIVLHYNVGPTGWQQCYHRVVDIQGDTEVELMLPYWNTYVISDTPSVPFKLYATLLAYSQPQPSVVTPIYINVYAAMGSDFKVYCPRNRILSVDVGGRARLNIDSTSFEPAEFTTESNPRLDFQSEFQPLHDSMAGYEVDNLVVGEEIDTYRDFIHRYTPVWTTQNNVVHPAYKGTGNLGVNGFTSLEMYGLIFRFHRGSIRVKVVQKDTTVAMVTYGLTGSATYEGTTLSSGVNPLVDFELPYYTNFLYEENGLDSPLYWKLGCPTSRFYLKAGGDDFSFHFLVPPPQYDWPSSATQAMDGLQKYLGP